MFELRVIYGETLGSEITQFQDNKRMVSSEK